jgi:hypothetical protein
MTKTAQLWQLKRIADLILDAQLAQVQAAAAEKAASEARLAALAQPVAAPEGIGDIAAGLAALGYQRWADARRAEVNLLLARQTVTWMEACDGARLSFGRKQALQGLADKAAAERKQKDARA